MDDCPGLNTYTRKTPGGKVGVPFRLVAIEDVEFQTTLEAKNSEQDLTVKTQVRYPCAEWR